MPYGPIFLVGAARSGTTLLQYMLRSHPLISLPTGESHFFIPYAKLEGEYGDLRQKDNLHRLLTDIYQRHTQFFRNELHGIQFEVDSFTDALHKRGANTLPSIIDCILSANAHGEGKKRWGDKTPYYILHMETLLEMFPDAQFVHIIRDGRDCAMSMLERKNELRIANTYHAAYIWNRYLEHGTQFGRKHPEIYKEIHYENLLSKPEYTMKGLCDFLGIEYSNAVINFRKSDGSGSTPLLTKPLQKNNIEKWRTKMNSRKISVFESVAGNMLMEKGYSLFTANARLSSIEEMLYNMHIRAFNFVGRQRLRLLNDKENN